MTLHRNGDSTSSWNHEETKMVTERLPRKCENDPFDFTCSPLLQTANDVADDEHEAPSGSLESC